MVYKVFEIIGKRVLIIDKSETKFFDKKAAIGFEELLEDFRRGRISVTVDAQRIFRKQKLGIFLESEGYMTNLYGGRAVLDFIEPLHSFSSLVEELAKGKVPRERVNPENPILLIHFGIDPLLLNYKGEKEGTHVFAGELWYIRGMFINDGNWEIYDKYKEPLKKTGFVIY